MKARADVWAPVGGTTTRVAANLSSSGTDDPLTGRCMSMLSGLPCIQTYSGSSGFTPNPEQGIIDMQGEDSYTNDPGYNCDAPWKFSGET